MDKVFEALAHPTRREILRLLRGGERTAGDLAGHFDMSKPSMSHHFTVLKNAGLVETRRAGQQVYYFLNTTVFQDVLAVLMGLFGTAEKGGEAPEGEKP